ncbi:MAG: carbamoyltransferase [Acidobacteria bacterium]|nr:carbamoyltransferase [Acidobacteriota bacterium]
MNILSFVYGDGGHDTSAALVCDGALVAAVEEERLTRVKHDGGLPLHAIDFCLSRAGIEMSQVDVLAFPTKPFRTGRDSYHAEMDLRFVRRLHREGTIRSRSLLHKVALNVSSHLGSRFNWGMASTYREAFALLRGRYGTLPPIRYYDHHRAHAAAAYLTAGWERAAVVTIDGRGGPYATVTWKAEGSQLHRLRAEPYTNSLGVFYELCTCYLGLGIFGQGKAMGLAAYGDSGLFQNQVARLLETTDSLWYRYHSPPRPDILGFSSRNHEPVVQAPYKDFAAACQKALEGAVARIVHSTIQEVGTRKLCLGGGVALNCSCNGQLLASELADEIWLFPASGDAGLPVGAALLAAADAGEFSRQRLDHAYWGPEFDLSACEEALRREPQVVYRRVSDPVSEVADALAAGHVVGWFQGRMELGPRALGHRSILSDVRSIGIRDRVNKIKGRESWRPLAPIVPADRASEFFSPGTGTPFMLFAMRVRPEARSLIPAVVHVDGSARPQTLTREQNQRLYDLLLAFGKITGLPVLLNTSFNAAGEPIVCTPEDALRTFLATRLDYLLLEDFLVARKS